MKNYRIAVKADSDLFQIWNYTYDKWSEQQANSYIRILLFACKELSENPEIGKDVSSVIQGLRAYKIKKHIIFYKLDEEGYIEILRILHERMDLRSKI